MVQMLPMHVLLLGFANTVEQSCLTHAGGALFCERRVIGVGCYVSSVKCLMALNGLRLGSSAISWWGVDA